MAGDERHHVVLKRHQIVWLHVQSVLSQKAFRRDTNPRTLAKAAPTEQLAASKTTMRAIQINRTGGPEVLELKDLPSPKPGPGQALIRIEASGVNFIDIYFREGRYPSPVPFIPGQEAAGIVEALGPEVPGQLNLFKVGDRVAWCGVPGTYAECALAPTARLVRVPDGVTSQQAAASLLQGMTAHYLAFSTYAIQPGDRVLVHAGAGGVGLLLIQIAKRLGARVFTTVSTDEKAALAREAGADEVILYTREDFTTRVKELTQGKGLPVVYDSVGKTTFEGSLACLRPRGLLALFGGSSGPVPPFDLIKLATLGSLFVTRPTLKDYTGTPEELDKRAGDIFGWIADGSLKVRVAHTYSLAEAAQAHRDVEGRKTTGKILLLE
jgi:NADPH2:quinone reductase